MKRFILALMLVILIPLTYASTLDVDITVSSNDIVVETMTFTFEADKTYDEFTFTTLSEPLSVEYDGEYSIKEIDDTYELAFQKKILPGTNKISFKLLFDDLIVGEGQTRVFRTGFSSSVADDAHITLKLPSGFVLADDGPKASPTPMSITTDGRHIILEWEFFNADDFVVAVFYQGSNTLTSLIIVGILILFSISVILFFYFKVRTKTLITRMLSDDEKRVVEEIRGGESIQKNIAKNLDFSKSKISKVIRKLEEKDLIQKTPHFKTNIIKLKKIK